MLNGGNGTFDVIGTTAGSEYRYYKTDWNNFAPSVSVAWSPGFESGIASRLFGRGGKTVLRAGYSHSYVNDQLITAINGTVSSIVGLGRQTVRAIGPANNTNLNLRLGDTVTIPTPVYSGGTRSFLQNNTSAQGYFGYAGAVDPNVQIPMVKSYSFGIQRELPWNLVAEARYVGTSSNNLLRRNNYNELDVINNGFLSDFQRAQANLALTGTTAFCDPGTVTGCQTLSLFTNGAIGSGPLRVGTGLTLANFNNDLRNGLVATLARRFVTLNLNNHPSLADPSAVPFVNFYQNPNIGSIEVLGNDAYYNYNSMQLELRKRFSNGLYLQANYTWSKNLTNGQGTAQALNETYTLQQNPSLDYQRANYDIPHSFNFNGIYQLPFGKGKTFFNQGYWSNLFIGGWELSGILQVRSGVPITLVDGRATLSIYSGSTTPNSSLSTDQIRDLIGVYEANGRIYWINPSVINGAGQGSTGYIHDSNSNVAADNQVFFNVGPGELGSLPRAFLNGPRYWNANMGLMKNFMFTETLKLQLRAEAFNVFNNVNFQNNTQYATITSTSFGQITSAASPRIMQFAFRFEF